MCGVGAAAQPSVPGSARDERTERGNAMHCSCLPMQAAAMRTHAAAGRSYLERREPGDAAERVRWKSEAAVIISRPREMYLRRNISDLRFVNGRTVSLDDRRADSANCFQMSRKENIFADEAVRWHEANSVWPPAPRRPAVNIYLNIKSDNKLKKNKSLISLAQRKSINLPVSSDFLRFSGLQLLILLPLSLASRSCALDLDFNGG